MTTEQKAKAYDEALEKAKIEINTKGIGETVNLCYQLFPELRENNERIRKSLIEFLTTIKAISESGRTAWAVRKEDAEMCKSFLAFLERQKEQNGEYGECTDFTIYHPLKNGKGEYECIPYSFYGSLTSFSEDKDLINFLRTCFYTEEECNEWIEKQKEQKPVQSDTEKEYIRTLKSLIFDFLRGKQEVDREYYQQICDWLDGHIEQEQIDLEKEIALEWEKCKPTDEGMGLESANIVNEQFDYIAHHFWNIGYNARKKE